MAATENPQDFRFGLRSLFWTTAIVAVTLSIPRMLYQAYYWQLNHVKAVLAARPEIENVRIEGNDDAFYEAEWAEFSIAGKPDSKVAFHIPHGARIDGGKEFWLSQLGPWSFTTYGHGHVGVYLQATGEPVKTDFFWDWIDVGSEGPFAKQIPIKANTVRDLVDHYDEQVEHFATWPNEENPGEIHDSAGTLLHYYVTGDSP